MKQTLCGYFRKLLQGLEEIIYPQEMMCVYCNRLSDAGALCRDCRAQLHADEMDDGAVAPGIQAVWHHQGVARRLVLTMKHGQKAICARILAEGMAERVKPTLSTHTIVTSVPMTARARNARGMDHGELLAREVAEQLGLRYQPLLRRVRETSVQKRLSAQERKKNMRGAFAPLGKTEAPVLLVDDVYTTGATVEECRKALLAGGATKIWAITATHTADRGADGGPPVEQNMLAGEPLTDDLIKK